MYIYITNIHLDFNNEVNVLYLEQVLYLVTDWLAAFINHNLFHWPLLSIHLENFTELQR